MTLFRQPFSTRWLDRLGAGVSLGCGLHGDPLRWLSWLEIGLTALLVGVVSGLHDLRFVGSGLAVAGGALMILAHWRNTRACRAVPMRCLADSTH